MLRGGLTQCHRCLHNAGVQNGEVKCLAFQKKVFRNNEEICPDQDGSDLPGPIMSDEEFEQEIKELKELKSNQE